VFSYFVKFSLENYIVLFLKLILLRVFFSIKKAIANILCFYNKKIYIGNREQYSSLKWIAMNGDGNQYPMQDNCFAVKRRRNRELGRLWEYLKIIEPCAKCVRCLPWFFLFSMQSHLLFSLNCCQQCQSHCG
jgi:hypothetical protein